MFKLMLSTQELQTPEIGTEVDVGIESWTIKGIYTVYFYYKLIFYLGTVTSFSFATY